MDSIITELTLDSFEKVLDENPCVIVDFWGDDCSYCKIILPELEKFALDNLGKCVFAKLRVDIDREAVSERFNVRGVPSFIVYTDGEETGRTLGFHGLKTLDWMQNLVDGANTAA